jgi:hypothetical protein
MRWKNPFTLLLGGAAAVVVLGQVLGRTSGTRAPERRRALPGDDLIQRPNVITNHAQTLPAPPEAVWPWLTQTGWHRGGWYTARWVDRVLFPANWASANRLDSALLRELSTGDTIPDGPPGTAEFVVEQVQPARLLVLHSTTHIPLSWQQRTGARIDWVWTFTLDDAGAGRTRMLVRTCARTDPWWLTLAYTCVLIPADHIMATSMLNGLAERVAPEGDC